MYINIEEVNRKNFNISERYLENVGKVYLITPAFDMHEWTSENVHLRSLLLDENFKIVSASFPKFKNYGENAELDLITDEAILSGNAWFTHKMDGSLIIRSVINGKVHIRTRGSHSMTEEFSVPVMNLIREKYPKLLDPTLDTRYSILFEYTSPDNKIVIPYEETSLTVLGLMDLSADPVEFVSSPELVQALEKTYETPAVKFHQLPNNISEVLEDVRTWQGSEGIVVWCPLPNGKIHLAKIKAAEYIRIHSLKFHMTEEKIRQYCWYKELQNLDEVKESFLNLGLDWETISFMEPVVLNYFQRKAEVMESLFNLLAKVEEAKLGELPNRKEMVYALRELTQDQQMFSILVDVITGKGKDQNKVDALILGLSTNQIKYFREGAIKFCEDVELRHATPKET